CSHNRPVGRETLNSAHSAENDFSRRDAATTNCTRCSRTSMVFQGILSYTPALATLARECKGFHGTLWKGCHETEQNEGKCGPPGRAAVYILIISNATVD